MAACLRVINRTLKSKTSSKTNCSGILLPSRNFSRFAHKKSAANCADQTEKSSINSICCLHLCHPRNPRLIFCRIVFVGPPIALLIVSNPNIRRSLIMAIDPVCGMEVDDRTTKEKTTHEGTTYYFCSNDCKEEFLA